MTRPIILTRPGGMPPPPAKRIKSDETTTATTIEQKESAVPVSPESEKERSVASIMRKRFASPTEDSSASKKMKKDDTASPTTSSLTSPKVDPNVFASAFALASLALSPTQKLQQQQAYRQPGAPYHSPNGSGIQTREDDAGRVGGDYSLREPSSPPRMEMVMPPSPETGIGISEAAMRRRRVKFASRMSMRSIPARVPYDGRHHHMSTPNRMMQLRHGPVFRHHAATPRRNTFQPYGAPSNAASTPPWNVPMGPPPPRPHHHPNGPPPPKETDWICDFCHVASFATYEEACAHESTCRIRNGSMTDRQVHDPHRHHAMLPLYDHHRIEDHQPQKQQQQQEIPVDDPSKYFEGTIALAVPSADAEWLSELNCYVRQNCVEAFSATTEDLSRASKRGRIALCQVGIRCKFCVHRDIKDKAVAAVSYPTTVSGIYESVKRWQRVHQSICQDIPEDVRQELDTLQNTSVWVPTTRQYWADSARALGMTDTHYGIRFERPPSAPQGWVPSNHTESSSAPMEAIETAGQEAGFVALPCDKDEIPEYVYFLMRQVESCRFTEADRFVARSKGPVGFAGFQCRHCNGHAGLGKYFPLTAKSLATNSTSQNIHAHLLKCRKCPTQIKDTLVRLKAEKSKSPRLVPGWRREFFDRIWQRMHGTPAIH